MAISRILGASLVSDLDRQGVDLQFTTSGNALVYMDFVDFRFGVNTNTPNQSLEVNGNILVANGNILSWANVSSNLGSEENWFNLVYANTVVSTALYGTIQTAAQPNITSVGSLTSLTVEGDINAGNLITTGTIDVSGNLSVDVITANAFVGTLLTNNQPYINILGNITVDSLSTDGNIVANILQANTANLENIYGTIQTTDQPYISNLGNISVDSITIGGNISITGNANVGIINADEIYENSERVLTANTNITVNGDVVGSGIYSNIYVTLPDTGIAAGIYGGDDDGFTEIVPKITVDSKGRITEIANVILTRVGNIDVNDTTISVSGNLNLISNSNIIDAGNSRISNIAEPINSSDAVTKSYLEDALIFAANTLSAGDSTVSLSDSGSANLSTILDNTLVSVSTVESTTFYHSVNVGSFSFSGNTIFSTNDIILNSANSDSVVQFATGGALGIPAGGTGDRPLTPQTGYTRFNTDTLIIETWDGNVWTSPGVSTITSETIVPDGINASFELSSNVSSAYGLLVSINGTLQQPVTAYDVNGNQITFTEIPQDSDIIEVRSIAAGVTVSALQYGTTEIELSTGNVNISGNLIPQTDVTYDIGSADKQWRDLFLSGNTIHLGGTRLSTDGNTLSFTPAGSETAVNLGQSTSTYTDANVAAYLPTHTGNISAGNINANSVYVDGESVASLISSANTNMKGYVDQQVTTVLNNAPEILDTLGEIASALGNDANLSTTLTNMIGNVQANVTTANTNMKGYVDAINSTLTANAGAQANTLATIQSTYAQLSGAEFTGALSAPSLSLATALPVSSGGTGGSSSSEALNNLLPSGETSGYVLKTGGPGSYYWSAETGASSLVGTRIDTSRTFITATSGQTVFANIGTYTPGAGQLRIYVDGVRQFDSAYTETSNTSFTLSSSVSSGTVVLAEVDAYIDYTINASDVVFSNVGTISATNVQDAIAELDTDIVLLFANAATQSGQIADTNTAITTANVNMKGYVDAANTIQSNQIAGANSAITTANVNMKGYVDAINSTLTANAGAQAGSISALETSKANLSGAVFTGNVTTANLTINGLTTLAETTETLDTKSSVTGTVVHDFSTTAIWYYSSISGNVTANFTNVPTTNNRITSVSIVINQGGTGYIVNGLQIDGAAQTIRWQANTVPTASTNRVDVFTFSLLRAADAWTVLGSATSHG